MEDLLHERLGALSLEQKVRLLTGADFWSLYAEPAVGLRRIVMSDGPAGVRGERWDEREPSANVPSPTALAATWAGAGGGRRPGRGRGASGSAACSPSSAAARASTCCSRRRSTSIARPTADATSS